MYIFTSIILCIILAFCHSAAFGTGTINPRPCTEGYYCTGATVTASPCPSGSFSNRTGLTQASECILCTPGSTCAASGLTAPGTIFRCHTNNSQMVFVARDIIVGVEQKMD
jgi:hypothetical protein